MNAQRIFRLRVTYALQGRLAMLSHLEVARTLERTVRRAGLPFAVTNGFSPHMKIAFGSALPVGVGGEREIYDLFLNDYIPCESALCALKESSPKDITPIACRYVEQSAPAASVAYPVGMYLAELSESPDALCIPDSITVVRKKKERVLNVADYLKGEVEVDGPYATFSLEALPSGSLRPDLFINECLRLSVENNPDLEGIRVLRITRISQSESENPSDNR